MRFNGRFYKGKFIPDSSVAKKYESLVRRCQNENMIVSVDVNQAERQSDSQIGLFYVIVNMASEQSGNSVEHIYDFIRKFRPVDDKSRNISFRDLNTDQMSKYIERVIIELNDFFNLNIQIELINGNAKVKC